MAVLFKEFGRCNADDILLAEPEGYNVSILLM